MNQGMTPRPLNTLERAVGLAQNLSRELAQADQKTWRKFRMFQALTKNEREAFAAFLVWKARAQAV